MATLLQGPREAAGNHRSSVLRLSQSLRRVKAPRGETPGVKSPATVRFLHLEARRSRRAHGKDGCRGRFGETPARQEPSSPASSGLAPVVTAHGGSLFSSVSHQPFPYTPSSSLHFTCQSAPSLRKLASARKIHSTLSFLQTTCHSTPSSALHSSW